MEEVSMTDERKTALIIGAGIGGLSLAMRLQAAGFDTTIVEALDQAGGRATVRRQDGFVFDMGPTVLTVPHFIEELFALERDEPMLDAPDFPAEILPKTAHATELRIREGISGGPRTSEYVTIRPILPFYRIYFDDGTYFDYDGDPESTRRQIEAIEPDDLDGYERFHVDARAIFERGFLELGYTYFGDAWTMLKVAPDLFKLDAVRSLFSFTSRYFKSDKLRQVFSFETLLVGGNPLRVPAIYAMIHFVEKTWGIHFAMGGTGALVQGMTRKYQDLGGRIRYDASVDEILVEGRAARGVRLHTGEELRADLVVSNADYATTYMKLIDKKHRTWNPDWKVKMMRYSMSLVVIYFGFEKREGETLDLQHHNIILGPRYEELLTDIFDRKLLSDDFSQYLHIPTLTDPSLAPEGHHAAYTLIPVPHNGSGLDWSEIGEAFVDKVLTMLDEEGFIPGLRERIVTQSHITPDHFEGRMQSYLGNAFGVEPRLEHSAFFRPHNRSEDITNLYLVGASAQPGAGTPSVMMSAKMTARAIVEDHGLQVDKVDTPELRLGDVAAK
ncbi:MAG: phytoene desaturase [Proteobacteria bacterium]|nr:phytoene desaturase [Pseudomonadota bacterium]